MPEPVLVQAMGTVARARYWAELDRLPWQTRLAIEDEVSDPLRWSARPNYHAQGCPGGAECSLSDDATTR